jgi:hypothetical protein
MDGVVPILLDLADDIVLLVGNNYRYIVLTVTLLVIAYKGVEE